MPRHLLARAAFAGLLALAVPAVPAGAAPPRLAPRAVAAAVLTEALARALPDDLAAIAVVPASPIPADAQVEAELPAAVHAGANQVVLLVRAPGPRPASPSAALPRRIWARADLRLVRLAAVSTRPLQTGEILAPGDLSMERRPVEEPNPPGKETLLGARLRHDLAAGAPLGVADVVLAPPEPRGAALRVRVRRGGVEISARGLLNRPARVGEPAAARLPDGHLVRGRLVDPGTLLDAGDAT